MTIANRGQTIKDSFGRVTVMSLRKGGGLLIGWAQTDITPPEPVMLRGQFYVRISESVRDPLTATVLVLDHAEGGVSAFVGCDLIFIPDTLRDAVRNRLSDRIPGLDPRRVLLNATHTHTGPELVPTNGVPGIPADLIEGIEVMAPERYVEFAAGRIADAVVQAWTARRPGGISWGLTEAVVSHNRRWVDHSGISTMYNVNPPKLSHVEGWEDHHVGALFTWSHDGALTGVVVNVPCPAQVNEHEFFISADYWHETRLALRRRLGDDLFVLPQCSPAGDLSPHRIVRRAESERLLRLRGMTRREEIAEAIGGAVESLAACLKDEIDWQPRLAHRVAKLELPRRRRTAADMEWAEAGAKEWKEQYEGLLRAALEDPSVRQAPRWYVKITQAYRRMRWYESVKLPQAEDATLPVEVHAVRLGDVAIATNPFELYVDFGLQIEVQSPAHQTFLVQLAGAGFYLPTARSTAGGGYGSSAASSIVGPEGGAELVQQTVDLIKSLW